MTQETPIACTLTADELPNRLESARRLGARALVASMLRAPRRAALRRRSASVDALVAAESTCCSFFTFSVTESNERVEFEILTPEGGELPMRSLVAGVVAGWEGGC